MRIKRNMLELTVLLQILISSMMHGQVVQSHDIGIFPPTGYANSRVLVFSLIVFLVIIVVYSTRNYKQLLLIPAASCLLPYVEALSGSIYVYIFVTTHIFLLARAAFICKLRLVEFRTSLSSLSIKNAIDSLHTGVMFCEDDGFILLANTQMRRLMTAITGSIQRNGRHFFELLTLGGIDPRCETTRFEGQNVIILPDGEAWMFTISDLKIRNKKYIQLTAADITLRWKLTAELQPQNEALKRRQDELSRTMENLHVLSRERETQRSKMRAHDILGERLTILLRSVRSEQAPDYALLRSLSKGLIDEIKAAGSAASPGDELAILKQVFQAIGVEIILEGKLPEDNRKGRLIVDIAREAVTNAVRHGLATRVLIEVEDLSGGCFFRITNNGHPPSESIREGGGIGGMRKKVEQFSGAVSVSIHPRFILEVVLPGAITSGE